MMVLYFGQIRIRQSLFNTLVKYAVGLMVVRCLRMEKLLGSAGKINVFIDAKILVEPFWPKHAIMKLR